MRWGGDSEDIDLGDEDFWIEETVDWFSVDWFSLSSEDILMGLDVLERDSFWLDVGVEAEGL